MILVVVTYKIILTISIFANWAVLKLVSLSYITEFIFLIVKNILHGVNYYYYYYYYYYCLLCRCQSFLIKFYCLICCWMTTVLCLCRACRKFGFLQLLTSL